MKYTKWVAVMLCMAVVMGLLAACGSTTSSQAPSRRSATSQAAGGGTQAEAAPADKKVSVSSDPYDSEIAIDGVLYALPAQVSQFVADGWQLQGGDEPVSYTNFGSGAYETTLTKDGQQLEVRVANFHTHDLAPAKDCQVTGIKYSPSGAGISVVVAGGITIGSSREEALAGFERTSEYDNKVNWFCAELLDYYFTIDPVTDTVTSIEIAGGGIGEAAAGSYDGTTPQMVLDYKAPTALGTDWQEGIIRLEGDLYQLPAPVTAFLDNGWKIVETEFTGYGDGMVDARSSFYNGGLVLEKDGKQLDTAIWNYDSAAQPMENCMVVQMMFDDTNILFELPGGITWDTSINTVKAQYGDFTTESYDYFYYEKDVQGMAGHRLILKYKNGEGSLLQVNYMRGIGIEY